MRLQTLKNVLIIGRFDTPTDYLRDFTIKNCYSVILIRIRPSGDYEIPLIDIKEYRAKALIFSRSIYKTSLLKTNNIHVNKFLHLLSYLFVILYLFYIYTSKEKFTSAIGIGPFNGWLGSLYHLYNKHAKTVYYVEDNVDYLGENMLDRLTKWCDKAAMNNCSNIWFMTFNHMHLFKNTHLIKKSILVPQPIMKKWKKNVGKKDRKIVFIGNVTKSQGADMLYEIFKKIAPKYKDAKLLIIGDGDYVDKLKRASLNDGIAERIIFKGFIVDREKVLSLLSDCYIGLALYNPVLYKNLRYGQSSKISMYLGCGLPAITTGEGENVPSLAADIKKYKAGYVLDYKEDEIYKYVDLLYKNRNVYNTLRSNTKLLLPKYHVDSIFKNAFAHLLRF